MGFSHSLRSSGWDFPIHDVWGMGLSHPLYGTGWGQRYTIFREWENPTENTHVETIHGVKYVHFQSAHYESFLDWWKHTPIGQKCISGKIEEKFQHPRWNKCRGDLWKHFVQLAEMHTGKSVLQCQACGKIIQHGIFTKNGASGMNKHLNTKDCKSWQREILSNQSFRYDFELYPSNSISLTVLVGITKSEFETTIFCHFK